MIDVQGLPPQPHPTQIDWSPHALREVADRHAVAIPVLPGGDDGIELGPGAADLSDDLGLDLFALAEALQVTGKSGEVIEYVVLDNERVERVLFVGLGAQRVDDFRASGAALARAVRGRDLLVTTVTSLAHAAALRGFVVGLRLGAFSFHMQSTPEVASPVSTALLVEPGDGDSERAAALTTSLAIAGAGWRARQLATVPSNVKNPGWLADRAEELGDEVGLGVTVWDEHKLADEGFGGVLAVGQGSATPPRLIRLDYTPRRSKRRRSGHVVLVGKGITFDTGGLSIKPAEAMVTMKRDMTGGAVVMSVMGALAAIDCPVKVTALVPAAENAISGAAMRPGDIIRHYGGRTSEVTNTDAEGRLVMADAIAYAADKIKPTALVDIATLTGAMKVALGLRTGGYFANHETLAAAVESASVGSGERLWRMPLNQDYVSTISSKVADADNAGKTAGAIAAALFLQPFAGDLPWAHLDVASVGDAPSDWAEWTAGPTGFGARTLLEWLGVEDPLDGLR